MSNTDASQLSSNTLSLADRLKIAVEIDKTKHLHFWNVFFYSVGAFAAVLIVPVFKRTEVVSKLYLYTFPAIAVFVVILSHWAMMAEYKRFRQYRDLIQEQMLGAAGFVPYELFGIYKYPIGKVISFSWLASGLLLSGFAFLALYLG